jgi:hypothetical protein
MVVTELPVLTMSISEIFFLALLLKRKTLRGFPNLLTMADTEKIQQQMDAARELLLARNILRRNGDGDFDVDETVIKIIVLLSAAPEYFSLTYEAEGQVQYKINFYFANKEETLVCKTGKEDLFYDIYLHPDQDSLFAELRGLFAGKISDGDTPVTLEMDEAHITAAMRREPPAAPPEGPEAQALLEDLRAGYGMYVINSYRYEGGEHLLTGFILETGGRVWIYGKSAQPGKAKLMLGDDYALALFFSDLRRRGQDE